MYEDAIEQQRHGYLGGHQLLATSINLDRTDQEIVDRLSDIAGAPGPGQTLPDYLTGYPLPSGRFFAFARTWYDASAPRAGCVITHTLLVPAQMWATTDSILGLAELHHRFEKDGTARRLEVLSLPASGRRPYPPTICDGRAEICEAMFLEDRKPIVWLTEPKPLPVLKLVEALWPALRARFAFQTFALKPRSKASGMFDLMVAPLSARARFSDWDGRRIEGNSPPRHAFTPLLIESIFDSSLPDLGKADPLGVLASDRAGDTGKLRLSILWNSLSHDEPRNLGNALGMLDVLAAAALPTIERWKRAEPLFHRTFEAACSREGRAAGLMGVALGKLENGDGARLSVSLGKSMTCLSLSEPDTALRLVTTGWRDESALPVILQSVAEAWVDLSPPRCFELLSGAPSGLAAEMVSREPRLAIKLARYLVEQDGDWLWLASLLEEIEQATIDLIRLDLLDLTSDEHQGVLLKPLMLGLGSDGIGEVLVRLSSTGALLVPSLVDALVNARSGTWRHDLRAAAARRLSGSYLRQVLRATIELDASDLDWLLNAEVANGVRSDAMAHAFRDATSEDIRRAGLANASFVGLAVEKLRSTKDGRQVIANLILAMQEIESATVELGVDVFSGRSDADSTSFLNKLMQRFIPATDGEEASKLLTILNAEGALEAIKRSGISLKDMLFPQRSSDQELVYAIGFLIATAVPPRARRELLIDLEDIGARVSQRWVHQLWSAAYVSWADLLEDSIREAEHRAFPASRVAFEYCVARRYPDLDTVCAAAFPVVYKEALVSRRRSRASAQSLRENLCRLYLLHDWDGVQFINVAYRSGDARRLFDEMATHWGGKRFLKRGMDRADLMTTVHDPAMEA